MAETKTVHSPLVTYSFLLSILSRCPPFQNGLQGFLDICPIPTATAWKIIAYYAAFEALLQLLLPGKRVEGPISPTGIDLSTRCLLANGMLAYFVTLATYLSLWWFGIFNPAIVYDHLGEIFSALNLGSLVFCVLLYIKSLHHSGSSRNISIDFYWLYPRIGKNFDIKVFTNCRFGMMSWAVLAVAYCIKQYEENGRVANSMLVNTILMLVYVTKFSWWEAGYWNSMDIAHDRAGFYICWGCLVWVPSVYTCLGTYLVNHSVNLGSQLALSILALSILAASLLCIYINYDCNRQRQEFRRTNSKCLVWGKAPSKIMASYTTTSRETKTSLLLTSGWWGLSRHFHYLPEILAAFSGQFLFLPYFYVLFITILLFHRAKRDDDRSHPCTYEKYWKLYCKKIPYQIIPGIY
ncbi:hypothetical protein UlMin_041859 [Ulmus minor]